MYQKVLNSIILFFFSKIFTTVGTSQFHYKITIKTVGLNQCLQ